MKRQENKNKPLLTEYVPGTEQLLADYSFRHFRQPVVICDSQLKICWCNQGFLQLGLFAQPPIDSEINQFLSADCHLHWEESPENQEKNVVLTFGFKKSKPSFHCLLLQRERQLMIVAQEPVMPDTGTMEYMGSMNQEMSRLSRELSKQKSELEKAYARINELISTDYLTGLASRKYLHESFQKAVSYFKRTGTPMTLIMADLDYFKKVNDQYGHLAGDKVLVQVSRLIRRIARSEDLIGRFGGEEFIIVLMGTNQQGGVVFAERLRQKTEKMKITGIPHAITISVGVTELSATDSVDTAIQRADDALYRAKNAGRNRVEVL